MRILTLNCGSSSIKAALIDTLRSGRLVDVRLENIATPHARLRVAGEVRELGAGLDADAALRQVFQVLDGRAAEGFEAVAHRVVHGGDRFLRPTLIDDVMLRTLLGLNEMAPLHNPPALAAIAAARVAFPRVPHVAVFDTAFHATLPKRAREYALPAELVKRHGIRRYGFHGTSHAHVAAVVAAQLRTIPQTLRVISCHLGNGASAAAIEYGRSVDTSMGMTPLEGLVMGTRAGDLDPGLLLRLQSDGFDAARLDVLLNRQSGLKGLTGTEDMQVIEQRAAGGDEACRLAIALFAHRVRKYIGAYAAVMGGVDAIACTGGIGEHSALLRHRILQRLEFLGAVLDEDRNRDVRLSDSCPMADIAAAGSRVKLFVVRADEESVLAREAATLLETRSAVGTQIPIAVSARHAHLSQRTLDQLFGAGYHLRPAKDLSQRSQYAAEEKVALIGPNGRIDAVRLMGPPRDQDQVEISRSDEFLLGIDAPVRLSGDLGNTPGITLEGPRGRVTLRSGVICSRRHIHMNPRDAVRLGVRDHQTVGVKIDSQGRDLVFGDVVVRIADDFELELHLDTDEANAAGVRQGDLGELLL